MAKTLMQDALEWTAGMVYEQYIRPTFDELAAFEMLLDELRENGALCDYGSRSFVALTSKHRLLFSKVGLPENIFRADATHLSDLDWLYWKAKVAMLRAALAYLT